MIRVLQKILLLLVVATVIGHSTFPHIHHNEEIVLSHGQHDESISGEHHHHDEENSNDNRHGVLSFAQLEDSYIPANRLIKNFELPVEFIPVLTAIICTDNFPIDTKTHFGWYKEYPSPDDYYYIASLRGPPIA